MKYFLFYFLIIFLIGFVKGDLPIHALMSDVVGIWEIKESEQINDTSEHCGGSVPNKNSENLRPELNNYEKYLQTNYGELKNFKINLTIEKIKLFNDSSSRRIWTYLAVRAVGDNNSVIGNWTMVYDEGFEIRLMGKRYFGFFKYDKKVSEECPSIVENINKMNTECYKTDPTKIRLGWIFYERKQKNHKEKIYQWGCFYAEKITKMPISSFAIHNNIVNNKDHIDTGANFFVVMQRNNYNKIRMNHPELFGSTKISYIDRHKGKENRIYGCKKRESKKMEMDLVLPKEFSWGDPYNNKNFDEIVEDQKECGSCYLISSIYILEKRFEILLSKKYKKNIKMNKLSQECIINLSQYNQACDGGFPFLVGKDIYENGICATMKYGSLDSISSKIETLSRNKKNNNNNNQIYYASDYNYISGCYECSNEFDMMKEILNNGPIIAAIYATSLLLKLYKLNDHNFIFTNITDENKICDIPNKGFNGWQQTNHAVVIVGWGEHINKNNELIKYWIIRNTWGNQWGYKGYLKYQRGINLNGIESQAVYIDPDFTRGGGKELFV
ncbi:dipeptidyl aminopeptidase 2 [Plasmodium berghei]|uniref:Dipeptidyl peptidase 1 n=2 Tax=Plasmodium berghei TaxID=5821 RepID=A0A509AWF2_PLABA|nr:dipeptidyl aminopeptidase 2 [Plasmodium berghei ANKA]CXJ28859.1 dipeptidyl aminopeptidase 2 [Plasmodium berghei]SCM27062.1 dipeptidyl aminopeptidase 2 [Plasmodium berghei]SCN28788.1 dipeptidyl aminopeptidase 2 [Plasmodium berghei]SCO63074.1 dipeptidyl aminopeptidase 2 [Plasmodium berghei]SCO64535.1 dipeptidyl aminopeptidase 2 [Plasmodium berghei]|eukprot:XP_034424434.1 dipeptidyl aminopeptidase 2 [Plasmodium berghei ANKA]